MPHAAPPPMASAEFDALMVRLYPNIEYALNGGVSRPMAALSVIQHLWIANEAETPDVHAFRAHMRHLERVGWFDVTDFKDS